MRKKLLLGAAAGLALVLVGLLAAWLIVVEDRPQGRVDTELGGISYAPLEPVPPKAKRKPRRATPALVHDRPCWLQFGGNPQRTLARTQIDLGRPTKPLWARGLGAYIEYPPSYCDGTLYVNTFAGRTFAIDARTGKVLWTRTGGPKPSTPAIAGPRLIVSSKDGSVTAFDRETGRTLWRLLTNAKVESSPVVVDGTVYFGATDGRVFALDARTGRARWAYDTQGRINSSPSVYGNRLCITTYAGSIFCLDRRNGQKLWSTYLKRDLLRYESFYASASTDGRRLYTVARSGKVYALDARTGKVLWSQHVDSWGYSTPAVAAGRVFVGGFDGALRAYRSTTGAELWRRHVGGRILAPAVVVGDLVFFSTLEQNTYAARVGDGKIVWSIGMGKYSPGIATDRRYYFSLNGILVAFRAERSPPEQVEVERPARASRKRRVTATPERRAAERATRRSPGPSPR